MEPVARAKCRATRRRAAERDRSRNGIAAELHSSILAPWLHGYRAIGLSTRDRRNLVSAIGNDLSCVVSENQVNFGAATSDSNQRAATHSSALDSGVDSRSTSGWHSSREAQNQPTKSTAAIDQLN